MTPIGTSQHASQQSGVTLYRRLLSYVRPYWRSFALAIFGYAIYAASSTALAEMMKRLIDGIQEPDAAFRLFLPLFVVGMFAARGLGTFLGTYYMSNVARNVVHALRCDVFNHMLHLPGRFFDSHSTGHLISRVTYHVEQVTGAATKALTILLREGLFVIGLVSYLLWTNWMLTLLFLAGDPLIGGVVSYTSKRFRRISGRIQASMGEVTHVASEALSGYRVVRTHGAEEFEKARFAAASELQSPAEPEGGADQGGQHPGDPAAGGPGPGGTGVAGHVAGADGRYDRRRVRGLHHRRLADGQAGPAADRDQQRDPEGPGRRRRSLFGLLEGSSRARRGYLRARVASPAACRLGGVRLRATAMASRRCSRASTWRWRRARWWRSSGARAAASRRWSACCRASIGPVPGAC